MEVVTDDPELTESVRELFESGCLEVDLYNETIEPQLIIADTRTMFLGTDEPGTR